MKEHKIIGLDHFGRGIIKDDGKTIFVENALIGEIVNIEIIKDKKKYSEAKVTKYVEKSPNRVIPPCPYYSECGGCDIMHMNYEEQLKFKENKIKEIMNKFKINTTIKPIISTEQFNYRNKITLQNKGKLGFYKKGSYDIVEIDKCLIAKDQINKAIPNLDRNKKVDKIVIRSGKELMISYNGRENPICDEIGNFTFQISPTAFFQVNSEGTVKLYNKILEYADLKGNENVLDLYCGIGTIGIYLSQYCRRILGVEINEEAVKDANINKEINRISNIMFKTGSVDKIITDLCFNPDIVIVDPPRSGLDNITIQKLKEFASSKIIYVSCDPVTLARDLNNLSDKYIIKEITPVDMFPNTHHVESICLLELKSERKD